MKALSGKQLARLVASQGWELRRVHGSHHIYGKAGSPVRLSIPIHGNRTLKDGLQRHFLRLAGMSESDL